MNLNFKFFSLKNFQTKNQKNSLKFKFFSLNFEEKLENLNTNNLDF
jgi:hypothetical protein